MKGLLVLEDGTVLWGEAFGALGEAAGEVVFNTGMTGYGEILTDPSYAGQIVVLTYPLVGNYGISLQDLESTRPFLRGLIAHEACFAPSHPSARWSLAEFLRCHGVVGLQGVDTRALVRHLRVYGTQRGALGTRPASLSRLREKAQAASLRGMIRQVTCSRPYRLFGPGPQVAVVDLGVKASILRALQERGCSVWVVPATWQAEQILELRPTGVLFSNGPGDPRDAPEAIAAARALLGRLPLFGICLGHQILALAAGARTYRLKYGHRGVNHPVRDARTGRVFITAQNHGYAVEESGLAQLGIAVSARHLHDETVEGLEFKGIPAFSVQYHPEARPGPSESGYLFDRFLELMVGSAQVGKGA